MEGIEMNKIPCRDGSCRENERGIKMKDIHKEKRFKTPRTMIEMSQSHQSFKDKERMN